MTAVRTPTLAAARLVFQRDMMLAWRARGGDLGWTSDAQFSLPRNYSELDADRRVGGRVDR